MKLSPNSLAFIALTNEYCQTVEKAIEMDRDEFVARMLKLLPRVYISASDLENDYAYSDYELLQALDEPAYDQVRGIVAQLMGSEDVYLEVFLDDMKYSDTPIATTVSENLADLYQEFFNFIASVKDATNEARQELIGLCCANFKAYWGQTLCNVLRALNSIYYNVNNSDL